MFERKLKSSMTTNPDQPKPTNEKKLKLYTTLVTSSGVTGITSTSCLLAVTLRTRWWFWLIRSLLPIRSLEAKPLGLIFSIWLLREPEELGHANEVWVNLEATTWAIDCWKTQIKFDYFDREQEEPNQMESTGRYNFADQNEDYYKMRVRAMVSVWSCVWGNRRLYFGEKDGMAVSRLYRRGVAKQVQCWVDFPE